MRTSSRIIGALALLILALSALVYPAPALGAAGTQSTLSAVVGQGTGRVIVSSTAEDQGTFAVQIQVALHAARPGTTFTVDRAFDLAVDGVCTLASGWLPVPDATLTTSPGGAGATHGELHRGAPFVSGVRFDVRFRAVGDDGTVLESACMTVTVK